MHLYFSGIGGSGLTPLSMLARDCGFEVSGSDGQAGSGTGELIKQGIKISFEQSYQEIKEAHQLKPIDWIIVSSSLPENHPHITFAKDNNIKISKRSLLINSIIESKNLKLIAISGTHGKTTTTAMITWLFKKQKIPVSYLIGSHISFGNAGFWEPGASYFIFECDEFDRNFLDFKPQLSVIPSLDYDHPDTYPTEENYLQAFSQFLNQSQSFLINFNDLQKLTLDFEQKISQPDSTSQSSIVLGNNGELGKFQISTDIAPKPSLNIPGNHNKSNASIALQTILQIATEFNEKFQNREELLHEMVKILNLFPGTSRRFEKIAKNIYSDYAHSPVEIAATLQLATEILGPNSELIVVYQPHQNIRQHEKTIRAGYQNCFEKADQIYWLPTYLSRENPELKILTPAELSSEVSKEVILSNLNQELERELKKHLENQDLILFLGAGDIDDWAKNFALKNRE